ncbi:hypothetical protein [Brachybacterium sp. YJGR34]|uniref:hypothetical protein n=1 Tax=Brachybacterium sp. YJGR34 TaxID=2059911 RepID=UPI0018E636D2|nr:hypothetical protein [Brachybacterium sp. YJGR34]
MHRPPSSWTPPRRPATGRDAAVPSPSVPIGLCAAWSRHAAELAVPLGAALERWEETPTTRQMVADGLLVRLLPGIHIPPDMLDGAVPRVLALGCALGERLQAHHVVAGPSAAWVILGGTPPSPAELLSPAHRGEIAGVHQRYSRLLPREVETLGGAPVTTPERTAMDLLRFAPDGVARPALHRLVDAGHLAPEAVARRLDGLRRHPGARAARRRLERMLAAPAGAA